jgi:hypothetical protein
LAHFVAITGECRVSQVIRNDEEDVVLARKAKAAAEDE